MDTSALIVELRKGLKDFNALRQEHPQELQDLSGADLSGLDLRGAQMGRLVLRDADFSRSDLTGANLSHADLRGAKFAGSKLIGVNLHKAELAGADFRSATLGGFDGDGRICINTWMFKGVRWGKEELARLLDVLNQNEDWEIRYTIVPKTPVKR